MDPVRNERAALSHRTIQPSRVASLARWAACCAAIVASLALPAGAQTPACADPRIHIDGPLDPAWAHAVLELCETLGRLPDLDPQIVIRIISSLPDVILEASLPDGRTALRRVRAPAELRATLEALATVPPPPPVLVAVPPPALPAAAAAPPKVVAARRNEASPPPSRPSSSLGLELGLSADLRAEGGPMYLSAGPAAYVGLRPGAWMVALQLRWQAVQAVVHAPPRNFEMSTLGFGFVVARRYTLSRAVGLDVGVSTSLLVQTQEYKPRGQDEDDELGTSSVDARVGPLTRLIVGRGAWRALLSLDADLSPVRLRHAYRLDPSTPYFPTYGVGLNVGACWGATEP